MLVFKLRLGYPERQIYALRPDAEGELSEEKLVWRFEQKSAAAYVPSRCLPVSGIMS